jgi:CcmD family protein
MAAHVATTAVEANTLLLNIALTVLVWIGLFGFAAFLGVKRQQLLKRRRQRVALRANLRGREFPNRSRRGT